MTGPAAGEIACQLKASGTVVLDATGHGTLTFDPDSGSQRWEVTGVVVKTDQAATATTVPVATLALNTNTLSGMSPGNQRGSTWSGNSDSFSGMVPVGPGDWLAVLFSPPPGNAGTTLSGVRASAVVTGTKYTRRT